MDIIYIEGGKEMFKRIKEMDDTKKMRYWAWTKTAIRIVLYIVIIVCCMLMLRELAPYVKGDLVLENPLTTSQLTAMLGMFIICGFMISGVRTIAKIGGR